MIEDLYTTTQAAHALGITPGAFRDAVARGRVQVITVGDRNYVTQEELDRYRKEHLGRRGRPPGK